jgi:thiol-disulfide isomerase/thioredoxin
MHQVLKFLIIGCLSALFLFSAIGKLVSMDQFESMLTLYGFGITSSAVAGRLILSLEFCLATLIWLPRYHRKMLYGMLYLTLAFTLGLIWFKFTYPDATDCGCHGELLKMNPMVAMFKNLGLIILAFAGIRILGQPAVKRKWNIWVMIPLVLVSLAVPPIVSPPDFIIMEFTELGEAQEFAGIEVLKQSKLNDGSILSFENEDKYILLFVTPGCKFCKLMATRIYGLKNSGHVKLPVYFVFPTDDMEVINEFWRVTQSKPFPYFSVNNFDEYLTLCGPRLPALFLMQGEKFYGHYSYRNFSLKQVEQFQKGEY